MSRPDRMSPAVYLTISSQRMSVCIPSNTVNCYTLPMGSNIARKVSVMSNFLATNLPHCGFQVFALGGLKRWLCLGECWQLKSSCCKCSWAALLSNFNRCYMSFKSVWSHHHSHGSTGLHQSQEWTYKAIKVGHKWLKQGPRLITEKNYSFQQLCTPKASTFRER